MGAGHLLHCCIAAFMWACVLASLARSMRIALFLYTARKRVLASAQTRKGSSTTKVSDRAQVTKCALDLINLLQ
jgi:hypothetical protein